MLWQNAVRNKKGTVIKQRQEYLKTLIYSASEIITKNTGGKNEIETNKLHCSKKHLRFLSIFISVNPIWK